MYLTVLGEVCGGLAVEIGGEYGGRGGKGKFMAW
jgi:hypothetical protein